MPLNHIFKNSVVKGTLILTIAGLISKLMGFYYKIFLSGVIGAEGIGLYQLVFPNNRYCNGRLLYGNRECNITFLCKRKR